MTSETNTTTTTTTTHDVSLSLTDLFLSRNDNTIPIIHSNNNGDDDDEGNLKKKSNENDDNNHGEPDDIGGGMATTTTTTIVVCCDVGMLIWEYMSYNDQLRFCCTSKKLSQLLRKSNKIMSEINSKYYELEILFALGIKEPGSNLKRCIMEGTYEVMEEYFSVEGLGTFGPSLKSFFQFLLEEYGISGNFGYSLADPDEAWIADPEEEWRGSEYVLVLDNQFDREEQEQDENVKKKPTQQQQQPKHRCRSQYCRQPPSTTTRFLFRVNRDDGSDPHYYCGHCMDNDLLLKLRFGMLDGLDRSNELRWMPRGNPYERMEDTSEVVCYSERKEDTQEWVTGHDVAIQYHDTDDQFVLCLLEAVPVGYIYYCLVGQTPWLASIDNNNSNGSNDDTEPKKPRSPYLLFYYELQNKMKMENPNITFGEIVKKAKELWNEGLSSTEKGKYRKLAQEDIMRYNTEKKKRKMLSSSSEEEPPANVASYFQATPTRPAQRQQQENTDSSDFVARPPQRMFGHFDSSDDDDDSDDPRKRDGEDQDALTEQRLFGDSDSSDDDGLLDSDSSDDDDDNDDPRKRDGENPSKKKKVVSGAGSS